MLCEGQHPVHCENSYKTQLDENASKNLDTTTFILQKAMVERLKDLDK